MALNIDLLGREEHPGPPPQRTEFVCDHKGAFVSWIWIKFLDWSTNPPRPHPTKKPIKRYALECRKCGSWGSIRVGPKGTSHSGEKKCEQVYGVDPQTCPERDETADRYYNSDRNKWSRQQKEDWWAWYSQYLESAAWRRTRSLIMERDGGECRVCSAPGEHVHHLTYERVGYEEPDDLVTLCMLCHAEAHAR